MVLLDITSPPIIQRKSAFSTRSSLTAIEAAYDLEPDDTTWLGELLHQIGPFIEKGLGVYGTFYEVSEDCSKLRIESPIFVNCPDSLPDALTAATGIAPAEFLRAIAHHGPPCHSLSEASSRLSLMLSESEMMRELERDLRIADLLIVNSWHGQGHGCCLVAPIGRAQRFPGRTASTLSRVARHIAAARRLRQAVSRSQGRISLDAEAVFDARGTVLHAEGEAQGKLEREILTTTVRSLVDAKERWRDTEPEQVTAAWNALVDGRWSLVDSFDRDGKRFLLARRNPLDLPEPSALTHSERQVAALYARGHAGKLVAYELGMTTSAVSSILRRALRKLRLQSRAELVALFNGQ